MPHIILEHNSKDKELVFQTCIKLHQALSSQETVDLEKIKTRSIFVDNTLIGDFAEHSLFAHVTLKLLPGRSEELKKRMSFDLLEALRDKFEVGALSVEVSELLSYSK